ncbi:hypothetical protein GCM10009745_50030 [Kribbella yunnanensis]|uniref:Uncharacterized protein n=1 Tax=Kribbella yunnanensis TaxID=190194 RepID=A0ABP4U282_9ACTN
MAYSANDLVIVEFDEHVRKRPEMYFGSGFDSPRFPIAVLESVAAHALHPAAAVAVESHTLRSSVDILDDRSFTITTLCPQDLAEGYHGSLITVRWLSLAATAVISQHGVVEVWSEGIGLRQELTGIRPSAPRRPYDAAAGSGMRVTLHLDPEYVVAFPSVHGLDLHSPYCEDPPRGGAVVFRDLRPTTYL